MGTVEQVTTGRLLIRSHVITYGHAADPLITETIRAEIETMWNEPQGSIEWQGQVCRIDFRITASFEPTIDPVTIYANLDPANNYFRIEETAATNISFVDGVGCNTGYFKKDNLYLGSTTAAHEYGHTLGLSHPHELDLRGKGQPGIMYPRGTLVDSQYQYDPGKPAGAEGGTLHPKYRKVLPLDISHLKIIHLDFNNGRAILGDFTSIWHPDHELPPADA